MAIAQRWEDLRALSDEELVAQHDEHVPNTVLGLGEYRAELRFRLSERSAAAQESIAEDVRRMTRTIQWLTMAAVLIAAAALVVALAG